MRINNSPRGCAQFLEETTQQCHTQTQQSSQPSPDEIKNAAKMLTDRLDNIKKQGLPIKPMFNALREALQKTKPSLSLSEKKLANMRPPELEELAEDLL
ncbi:MAG: hypothetical protein GY865_19355 [candidate division Zixibacteria bacterium]|nr:hypothetical protein [candidate division Zixibacteria bacterium]